MRTVTDTGVRLPSGVLAQDEAGHDARADGDER
jgi:hypothetical protein